MTSTASSVIAAVFDRFAAGGPEAALELVADDAVFVVPPELSAEPDTYEGREGGRRYFAGFAGVLDDVRFELVELEEVGGGKAVGLIRLSGRGATTGIDVEQLTAMAFTVRDGLIARIEAHPDTDSARRALSGGDGLP